MKNIFFRIIVTIVLSVPIISFGQDDLEMLAGFDSVQRDKVISTFKSGSIINLKTIETLGKGELDFRVDHRFGDIAGKAGGAKNFFGLDNSTDIKIGFDYGLTDELNFGIYRAKGASDATQLYEGAVKYRFLDQTQDDRIPVSLAFFASATLSAAKSDPNLNSPVSFRRFKDRFVYVGQLIIARKFSSRLSILVSPSYLHRNYTAYGDQNAFFAIGFAGRIKITRRISLLADYFLPFRNGLKKTLMESTWGKTYYNPLGIGLEIETGGHVFSLNFTNSKSIQEAQLIPETYSSWGKGQFRWGFGITRRFSLTGG